MRGSRPSGIDQIDGFGAHEFNIGPRGIEVRVVGNHVTLLAHHAEKNPLGSAPLVGGNDVAISEDVLHRIAKAVEALAACVTFVAFHNGGPLVSGHRAGAGIGEQVDQHVGSGKKKEIVVRGAKQLQALIAAGPADRLDALDAKRFDDGAGHGAYVHLHRIFRLLIRYFGGALEFVPGERFAIDCALYVLNKTIENSWR